MSDRELRDEFIRVEQTGSRVRIRVCEIHWDGPHTPVPVWVTARELPATAGQPEIEASIAELLGDPEYFRACRACRERRVVGWMHDERLCSGCAESILGIVH